MSDFSFDSQSRERDDIDEKQNHSPAPLLATIQESCDASVASEQLYSSPPSAAASAVAHEYRSSNGIGSNGPLTAAHLSTSSPDVQQSWQKRTPVSGRRHAVSARPVPISETRTPTKPAFQVNTSKASTPQSGARRSVPSAAVSRSGDREKNNVPVATVSLSLHKSQNTKLASSKYSKH